jgi:carotenoid cleavage dioxygenase
MGFDNRTPTAMEHTLPGLPVTGKIPDGLRGTLFRNGPNPLRPDPAAHWFIGDGMVHAFSLGADGAAYTNRWVRTQSWADAHGLSVAEAPAGVANTNILSHAGHLLALEEMHLPVAIDPASLATLGAEDFAGTLPHGPFTAHPKHDPRTGALVFFGYAADGPATPGLQIGELAADGTLAHIGRAEAPFAAMIHDFAVTEQYIAIPLFPLVANPERFNYVWQPEKGAWLGVMERRLGIKSLRWHRAGAGFAFHTMNAWDENNVLTIDLMLSDAPPFFPTTEGQPVADTDAKLCRWQLDLADPASQVTSRRLSDIAGEFPRIDDRFAGSRTRHGYFTTFGTLCHRDDVSGREMFFRLPPGDTMSEPVFVPRGEAEGDGWLLAVIFRAETCTSDLAIFDATDLPAGPLALVHLPCRVPAGFHGNWVGEKS